MFGTVNYLVEARDFHGEVKPVTTSRKIAEYFGKDHFHVVRDIRDVASKCSESFVASNFGLVNYTDAKGQLRPMYLLTRDGFAMVAMGYTGEKAMRFKEQYIAAFNAMEEEIKRCVHSNTMLPDFSNPAEAARAWADEYEKRVAAQKVIEEQAATIEAQEIALGDNRDWKAVTAIPWLRDVFADTSTKACSRIGKTLSALSRSMGMEIRKAEDSKWSTVNVYHITVINYFKQRLDADPSILCDIRK